MLYKINQPTCIQHLQWIVRLQSDLLRALCDPNIVDNDVTNNWVKNQIPSVNVEWVDRFCSWSLKKKSMLIRMRMIAKLAQADKGALITHYENNILYLQAFDCSVPSPPVTVPLSADLSAEAASAYSGFFEMFYAPIFYEAKGYPIESPDLNGKKFTRNKYLSGYKAANPHLKVCPLCDGDLDGAELDHWLAKVRFPELNCHPQNLVEICSACNKRANKGEKLVLDEGETVPFDNWFHPYLRPAVGLFRIEKQGNLVKLISDDANTQKRLDNMDSLINLGKRWSLVWKTKIGGVQAKIRGVIRRERSLNEEGLRSKIEDWKNQAEDQVGIDTHALLEAHILSQALEDNSNEFEEFRSYARER